MIIVALATGGFAAEPVKIGFFMSITGRDASFGEVSLRGARLAVEELNVAGGVLGCYSTHFATENTDRASRAFVAAYTQRSGSGPNGPAALTYDAVKLAADAIARAGTTEPASVRAAQAATKDFAGVTGRTTINAQRDADKEAAIIKVKDGKLVFVEAIRP